MGRRGATDLAGILLVDKPAGLTSHDVVARVRRVTGEGRVGHAGTLDPMATGLLVLLVGPYTRLEPYLSSAEKEYTAAIAFGSSTDTDDAEGTVIASAPVPPGVLDADYAAEVLHGFLGASMQLPPSYSAIKVGGAVAHRAARSGSPLELAERSINVLSAELLGVEAETATWNVAFRVSKGTYIRALARDIGERLGVPAHLAGLRRTASGTLRLEDAQPLEGLTDPTAAFVDPLGALGLPVVEVESALIANGAPLDRALAHDVADGVDLAVTCAGELRAVYSAAADRLIPRVVLPHGGPR